MSSLQKNIRNIQLDTTLSSSEKKKKISDLMCNFNKSHLSVLEKKSTNQVDIKCTHYDRKCDMICTKCNNAYPCRLCHDSCENHKLDRFIVTHIKCRDCNIVQKSSNKCINCNIIFGKYYCGVCHLWDNSDKEKFHCFKCGICRIGNRNDWTHCDKCKHCFRNGFKHTCIDECTKKNCPICNDYIFDSPTSISILKCGHAIHTKCLENLLKHDYRCPYCKKTAVESIKEQWKIYDQLSSYEPIPEDFKNKRMVILCNDCGKKSDIKFTFEFLKCNNCGGYNTGEINTYE